MKFEVLGPNGEVARVVETQADSVRIGKNSSCELCLDDPSVSRVHAVLERSGDSYKISDRISASGTFVNDQKLAPSSASTLNSGDVVRFGNVSVRVLFDVDAATAEPEEGGATLAMDAPSLEAMAAQPDPAPASPASPVAAQAANTLQPSVSVPHAAAVSSAVAAAANMPKPSGFGAGFGGAPFSAQQGPTTIIRKKKRATSFERRFLSNRGTSDDCVLEVALVWRDYVISIQKFNLKNGVSVTVGEKNCNFILQTGKSSAIPLLQCNGNRWHLIFNTGNSGFVLLGDQKKPFSECSSAEFRTPSSNMALDPGTLSCEVTGDVRAKFNFGEASILVHYVNRVPFAIPLFANFKIANYGPLIASLIVHFSLFSVILFATNRVDALMVDRIMTASRFANVVEQQVEEEEKVDEPDEEEPEEEEEEVVDSDAVNEVSNTPFAANTNSGSSSGVGSGTMSKGEANAAAQATGLLAQSNAMNSMLAAGMDMGNLDNLDWSSFDASAQAASSGYGLGTTGTGGGGAGLGGFGGGGFGPGGPGGSGAIRSAAAGYNANIGTKGEAKPTVKMKNPEVSGSLDKRIIQKVVRQHHGELRACYEREVAKVKGLSGTVTVVWLISPQGAVTKVFLKSSTIKNKNVENCVANSIKFWRFPAPKGGGAVSVEYPFDFQLN